MEMINTKSLEMRKIDLTDLAGNLEDLSSKSIRDVIINSTEEPNFDYLDKAGSRGIIKTIAYYLNMTNPLEWVFLVFFAFVITSILFIFDLILALSIQLRFDICTSGDNPFVNFIFWIGSAIVFILLATSTGYFISADADGSGIPEVKTVLSGINIYRYFSVEAFVAKILGLYAAIVGGILKHLNLNK